MFQKKMLKILISFVCLFPVVLFPREVVLSQNLTFDMLKGTKISQKKIESGIIIIITSKNPRTVERIKKIITRGVRFQYNHSPKSAQTLELLRVKQIKKSLTLLNNGVRLNLSTDKPEWMDQIKKLKIPRYIKKKQKP